jgi:hypothetical protein
MAAKLFEDSPQVQTPVGFSWGSLYLRLKKKVAEESFQRILARSKAYKCSGVA